MGVTRFARVCLAFSLTIPPVHQRRISSTSITRRLLNWRARPPASPVERLAIEPVAPAPLPVATGSLEAIVIDIVAEKTGYPADVLELDMQLDADLGIDSIKRVEILSALQDRVPSLPSIPPELLGTLRSLRSIFELIATLPPLAGSSASPGSAGCEPSSCGSPEIARILLETVADKTGYPAEMLELDMRLDADLGIDSIKRVEIFSAIQDRLPGACAAGPEEIGTLGTLRDIVAFLGGTIGSDAGSNNRPSAAAVPVKSAAAPIEQILLESVADKTGFPIDMLELDMQLDVDLGIDSIKRVEILSAVSERLPSARSLGPEQLPTLRTLRQIAEFLSGRTGWRDRSDRGTKPRESCRSAHARSSCRRQSSRARTDRQRETERRRPRPRAPSFCARFIRGRGPSRFRIVARTWCRARAERCGSPTMDHRWPRPWRAGWRSAGLTPGSSRSMRSKRRRRRIACAA